MDFQYPWVLAAIPFVVAFLLQHRRKYKEASFRYPSHKIIASIKPSWKVRYEALPFVIRLTAVVLLIVAIAGPRQVLEETTYKTEGIDIIVAIDLSGSMRAEDFALDQKRVNRLEVVKRVVKEFVKKRESDQIGLVAFALKAYTVCPLTIDNSWLESNIDRLELGMIDESYTAIGSGMSTAIARLENSKAKSRIIILLTDGENNSGTIDPLTAAKIAAELGIKIYTIGVGTNGMVPVPAQDMWGRTVYRQEYFPLDEETLKEIARISGANYYRATDTESLRRIYEEIDRLEKVEIEEIGFFSYKPLFDKIVSVVLILFMLELLLSHWLLFKIP